MSDTATETPGLLSTLIGALEDEFDGLELIEKASATRMRLNGVTLGYIVGGKRTPTVHVPAGHGAYDKLQVKAGSDVAKTVKAVKAYAKTAEKAAADKAAAKVKSDAEKKAKAAEAKKAKTEAAKKADAKAKTEAAKKKIAEPAPEPEVATDADGVEVVAPF